MLHFGGYRGGICTELLESNRRQQNSRIFSFKICENMEMYLWRERLAVTTNKRQKVFGSCKVYILFYSIRFISSYVTKLSFLLYKSFLQKETCNKNCTYAFYGILKWQTRCRLMKCQRYKIMFTSFKVLQRPKDEK